MKGMDQGCLGIPTGVGNDSPLVKTQCSRKQGKNSQREAARDGAVHACVGRGCWWPPWFIKSSNDAIGFSF